MTGKRRNGFHGIHVLGVVHDLIDWINRYIYISFSVRFGASVWLWDGLHVPRTLSMFPCGAAGPSNLLPDPEAVDERPLASTVDVDCDAVATGAGSCKIGGQRQSRQYSYNRSRQERDRTRNSTEGGQHVISSLFSSVQRLSFPLSMLVFCS